MGEPGSSLNIPVDNSKQQIFPQESTAEVEALTLAANFIRSSEAQCPQVVFLTDALSVLEALD